MEGCGGVRRGTTPAEKLSAPRSNTLKAIRLLATLGVDSIGRIDLRTRDQVASALRSETPKRVLDRSLTKSPFIDRHEMSSEQW